MAGRRICAGYYRRYDGKTVYVISTATDADTGEEIVIWVLEKHNNDVVSDGAVVRVSGVLAEFSDYDVILKDGRCSGSCSVSKQMDGSIIVEREKIISIRRA